MLNPLYLETAVVCLGLVLLLIEAFAGKLDRRLFAWTAIVGLAVVFVATFFVGMPEMPAPWQKFYALDPAALFFKRFALATTIIVLVISVDYLGVVNRFIASAHHGAGLGEFIALPLFTCAGLMWMASAVDFVMIFVSLELVTISFYVLVTYTRRRADSLEAGVKYLILGALSTGFFVYGITWIFGLTGQTNLTAVARVLPTLKDADLAMLFAFVLLIIALGFKIAAAPFQLWVPDVYQGAPTPVTAFLSVGSKAAGFIVLLRVLDVFLGVPALVNRIGVVLVAMAAATLLYGNLAALPQTNLKRLLAYSSIAHAGYLLIAVVSVLPRTAATAPPVSAGDSIAFYLAGYLLMTLLSFAVMVLVSNHAGGDDISHFNGLAKRAPRLAFAMLIAMLSLAGIPFTVGFFAKFFIFAAAYADGQWLLLVIGVLSVACGFYYYLKVVRAMYFQPSQPGAAEKDRPFHSHGADRRGARGLDSGARNLPATGAKPVQVDRPPTGGGLALTGRPAWHVGGCDLSKMPAVLSLRSPASLYAVMLFPLSSRILSLLLAALLGLCSAGRLAGQDVEDPSEVFLKAFTSVQQGEKLEKDGSYKFAVSKYRFASSLLEQIQQRNPNWQPLIVQYRMRKTAEAIARAEGRLTLDNTPAGAVEPPPPTPTPPPRTPMPPSRDGVDPLPTNDATEWPSVRRAVPANAPLPSTDTASRATKEARLKLDRLQQELDENRKALNAAKDEKDKLESQLQASRAELKTVQRKAERATANATDLETQLTKSRETLKEALAKNPDANETRRELRDQVAELQKRVTEAEQQTQASTREREDLANRLAEATQKLETTTSERDKATERAEQGKDTNNRIDTLVASNAELQRKLESAESDIRQLNADASLKRQESETLRTELTVIREQLSAAKDRNDRSDTTITELRAQLDQTSKDLAELRKQGATSEEVQRMTRENDLLRGIVLQQLKEQAKREQAKKLLTQELARLEIQSKTISDQVAALGTPSIQLNDEVRGLFRDAAISIVDAGDTTMAVTIAAVKQPGSGNPPAAGAAPGATPGPGPVVETNLTPKVPEEMLPLAREMKESLDGGRYPEAEKACEKILARDPQNLFARSNLGVAFLRQGKLKQAEMTLKRALATDPNDAFSRASLGVVYSRMRKYDEAIDQLTKAISLDPKSASAHNHLGIVAGQKGWTEAAEQEFKKAIALNPNYADAHFNLAVIYATNLPPAKQQAGQHYQKATSLGASPDAALEKLINN